MTTKRYVAERECHKYQIQGYLRLDVDTVTSQVRTQHCHILAFTYTHTQPITTSEDIKEAEP